MYVLYTCGEHAVQVVNYIQIAGAAAERGKILAEVTALAQNVADNVGKWIYGPLHFSTCFCSSTNRSHNECEPVTMQCSRAQTFLYPRGR